jgi:hypothetical protein
MAEDAEERLGRALQQVRLPELNELDLAAYLRNHGFVEAVMRRVYALKLRAPKALAWAVFCVFNLALLVLLGASETFLADFFAPQPQLAQFFFLFLGLTLLGGLVGLVLCLDTSRLQTPRQ